MTDLNVSAPRDVDELKSFVLVRRRTYLMSPEDGDAWAEWVPLDNVRILRRGDKMIGGLSVVPMGQWFGGKAVRMTGISAVGIEPAERATGAGTWLTREILHELHASGVAISSLFPATQLVYRRCGYELAGDYIRYTIAADHIDVRDRTLAIELTDDQERVKALYASRARRTAGVLDRSDHMWQRVFEPYKREAAQAYVVGGDDGDEGYIVYSRTQEERVPGQQMHADVVALTPGAARRILAFVADHRSFVKTLNWTGPSADPFAFALSEPRRRVEMSWPWMLRIVDVERALAERGYPAKLDATIEIEVDDVVIASNSGPFTLRVAGGSADVQRGGTPRLKLDVRGLATLYTGYMTADELRATGYIEGPEEDVATASAIFAGPAPWLADFF